MSLPLPPEINPSLLELPIIVSSPSFPNNPSSLPEPLRTDPVGETEVEEISIRSFPSPPLMFPIKTTSLPF